MERRRAGKGGELRTEATDMGNETKRIALVDWCRDGHHQTYFQAFSRALSRLGVEVVPFCAFAEEIRGEVGKWSEVAEVHEPVAVRYRPLGRLGRGAVSRVARAVLNFGRLGRQLRGWEAEKGKRLDGVFFACIYDYHFDGWGMGSRLVGRPWGGLYLHARSFRLPGQINPAWGMVPCPERIFTVPGLTGVGVLDEAVVGPMDRLIGGERTVLFPDITEERLPEAGSGSWGLAEKVTILAAGRPVVALMGHLQWTKGLLEFTRMAADPANRDLFFFLGGEVSWSKFSEEEKRELRRTWEEAPNLYAHLQGMPELTFNAVVSRVAVVYAAYRDFPNSSNLMTKAALFGKPVVVSDGYLMAERVREYVLGAVVPEGDQAAIGAAVRGVVSGEGTEARGYGEYAAGHLCVRLETAFGRVLELMPKGRGD